MTELTLQWDSADETVRFAADELARYLKRMDPSLLVRKVQGSVPEGARCIRLRAESNDRFARDAVDIDVEAGSGRIVGSNPRSVLLGVYRLLHRLGFRFLSPGPDGERIPTGRFLESGRILERHEASHRHRGLCIEGSVQYEHVADLIDWLPKNGFNAFFTQFLTPNIFFQRWHAAHPEAHAPGEVLTKPTVDGMVRAYGAEIRRRGLLHHRVGHGWLCAPYGLDSDSWDPMPDSTAIPDDVRNRLALVGGSRALLEGVPIKTSLCLSRTDSVEDVVRAVVDYCGAAGDADYVHVWLSDGLNGDCECDACRGVRPADQYLRLLRRIDEELTARANPVRIVFLLYFSLLWPPEVETLPEGSRFVLMFAPISREYSRSFDAVRAAADLPPFVRNRLVLPKDLSGNLAFLRAWQETAPVRDSFLFDYPLMWDHYFDLGYHGFARVLHRDAAGLEALGLDGCLSCQPVRAFFPHGFALFVLGQTLWDRDVRYEDLERVFYESLYGGSWRECLAYLRAISETGLAAVFRGDADLRDPAVAASLRDLSSRLDAFDAAGLAAGADPACATAFRYLVRHRGILLLLADAMRAFACGREADGRTAWQACKAFTELHEVEYQDALDVPLFLETVGNALFRAAGAEKDSGSIP